MAQLSVGLSSVVVLLLILSNGLPSAHFFAASPECRLTLQLGAAAIALEDPDSDLPEQRRTMYADSAVDACVISQRKWLHRMQYKVGL